MAGGIKECNRYTKVEERQKICEEVIQNKGNVITRDVP